MGGFADARHLRWIRGAFGQDPDLQVRCRGDADPPAADICDGLAGADMRADRDERTRGVTVVDIAAAVGPAVHEQDRGRRAEAAQALAHDRAARHGELAQARAALVGIAAEVDALVERPPAAGRDARERIQREDPASRAHRIWASGEDGCGGGRSSPRFAARAAAPAGAARGRGFRRGGRRDRGSTGRLGRGALNYRDARETRSQQWR